MHESCHKYEYCMHVFGHPTYLHRGVVYINSDILHASFSFTSVLLQKLFWQPTYLNRSIIYMNGYRIYMFRNPTHLLLLHQHKRIVYMCSDTLHTFIAVCIHVFWHPASLHRSIMYVFWHPTYLHRVIFICVFWHPMYLPLVIVFMYSDTLHASITVSYTCVLTLYNTSIALWYICVLPPSWYRMKDSDTLHTHITGSYIRVLTPYIPPSRYRICVFWHPIHLHCVIVFMYSDTLHASIVLSCTRVLTLYIPSIASSYICVRTPYIS